MQSSRRHGGRRATAGREARNPSPRASIRSLIASGYGVEILKRDWHGNLVFYFTTPGMGRRRDLLVFDARVRQGQGTQARPRLRLRAPQAHARATRRPTPSDDNCDQSPAIDAEEGRTRLSAAPSMRRSIFLFSEKSGLTEPLREGSSLRRGSKLARPHTWHGNEVTLAMSDATYPQWKGTPSPTAGRRARVPAAEDRSDRCALARALPATRRRCLAVRCATVGAYGRGAQLEFREMGIDLTGGVAYPYLKFPFPSGETAGVFDRHYLAARWAERISASLRCAPRRRLPD